MLAKIQLITQSKTKTKKQKNKLAFTCAIGPVVYLCLWGKKQYVRASCM